MYSPRIKALENCARAAGGVFACLEEAGEQRYRARPGRAKKAALIGVLTLAFVLLASHHFGWAKLVAVLPGLWAIV